ncbi:ankyrin repeat domain-containing protein 40-like [Lytechinus variegatus]|uniref:ankyrin repeat domain-containing protein 40-like n=1 Tax=Lytechinus variegatus TaxID=7654 RepID=UPI001BB1162B|nr:ankyrin repeat domain-containing protein 40-like [Lytechinus variegatus]
MDGLKVVEEKLRESASIGDQDGIEECLCQGADINSQNKMNGWTALHWASKRGHPTIVNFLLGRGADPSISNHKGELPVQMTDSEEVKKMIGNISGIGTSVTVEKEALPFTPNYLMNPPFPHGRTRDQRSTSYQGNINGHPPEQTVPMYGDELVLKIREAESAERDFIEVELPRNALTFENLVELCCEELQVEPSNILKIRKLPNTIIRKDKDVVRLQDFQELELVTKKKTPFGSTPYTVPLQNLLY